VALNQIDQVFASRCLHQFMSAMVKCFVKLIVQVDPVGHQHDFVDSIT